jgi:hypothetical protein
MTTRRSVRSLLLVVAGLLAGCTTTTSSGTQVSLLDGLDTPLGVVVLAVEGPATLLAFGIDLLVSPVTAPIYYLSDGDDAYVLPLTGLVTENFAPLHRRRDTHVGAEPPPIDTTTPTPSPTGQSLRVEEESPSGS